MVEVLPIQTMVSSLCNWEYIPRLLLRFGYNKMLEELSIKAVNAWSPLFRPICDPLPLPAVSHYYIDSNILANFNVCHNICGKIYSEDSGRPIPLFGWQEILQKMWDLFLLWGSVLSVLRNATQDYFRKIKKTIAKTGDDSRVSLLNINILYL